MGKKRKLFLAVFALALLLPLTSRGEEPAIAVAINWQKTLRTSATHASLQVVVSSLMRRGAPTHDKVFEDLRDLGCEYVRFDPWLPYPKLGVAELEPPHDGKASWDFSLIDPIVADFVKAQGNHKSIWNFSIIPQWMFVTPQAVPYPADPDEVTWAYQQGTEFRDPSLKELADYYGRLVSWYTQGGFTDEYGKRQESGHHYKIDYWEVLNEPEIEHFMSRQTYTRVYDAMVEAIHRASPATKFVGMALTGPMAQPEFFEYFLNARNHKPGIPLDMISYHFYAVNRGGEDAEAQQFSFFAQADAFLDVVRYIQDIRARLSPQTQTTVDELGTFLSHDLSQGTPGYVPTVTPDSYWNLSAAVFAYVYGGLANDGVEVEGESALAQLPGFYPTVTMVDWTTGKPNARYWVLKMIRDNFGPGDQVVQTGLPWVPNDIYAQGFVTPRGKRKVLLVNKRDRTLEVSLAGVTGADEQYVDQTTAAQPPGSAHLREDKVVLKGYAVAVVTLPEALDCGRKAAAF